MIFTLKAIEFDFDDDIDHEFTQHYRDNITAIALEYKWIADSEDDLIETITADTGWCIKSIDYEVFLNDTE